jgi:hypothetical protein
MAIPYLAGVLSGIKEAFQNSAQDLAATTAITHILEDVARSKPSKALKRRNNDFTEAVENLTVASKQANPNDKVAYLRTAEARLLRVVSSSKTTDAQKAVAAHYGIVASEGLGKRDTAKHFYDAAVEGVKAHHQKKEQADTNDAKIGLAAASACIIPHAAPVAAPVYIGSGLRMWFRDIRTNVTGERSEVSGIEGELNKVKGLYR